jgi:hypothetical protein
MRIYLPLKPGSKEPAVGGWASPDYPGVEHSSGDWHGLRADALVIMDFDSAPARSLWWDGDPAKDSLEIKTPRGWHVYYRWTPGSPEGPAVGVWPDVDVRAGRGSYVVAPFAPGYEPVQPVRPIAPFNPTWLPKAATQDVYTGLEWDRIPEGRRNHTLAAIAGTVRKQGGSPEAIGRAVAALNAVLLDEPLGLEEVVLIARSVARYSPRPDILIEMED